MVLLIYGAVCFGAAFGYVLGGLLANALNSETRKDTFTKLQAKKRAPRGALWVEFQVEPP